MPLTIEDLKTRHRALSERNWAIFGNYYYDERGCPEIPISIYGSPPNPWNPRKVRRFLDVVEEALWVRVRYPEAYAYSPLFVLRSLENLLDVIEYAIDALEKHEEEERHSL